MSGLADAPFSDRLRGMMLRETGKPLSDEGEALAGAIDGLVEVVNALLDKQRVTAKRLAALEGDAK